MKTTYLTPATQAIEISTAVIMGASTEANLSPGGESGGDVVSD